MGWSASCLMTMINFKYPSTYNIMCFRKEFSHICKIGLTFICLCDPPANPVSNMDKKAVLLKLVAIKRQSRSQLFLSLAYNSLLSYYCKRMCLKYE